jgi:predicted nucleotidyltransferase
MVDMKAYIQKLIGLLQQQYGPRLTYVGLQGSYLRGEATENSDIDVMVVIENLAVSDLDRYRDIIESLPHADKSCGFICGKNELANWNPLEMWSLLHGTKDYYGSLHTLIPTYTEEDIRNFVKLSVNNLYHEICHRYVHAGHSKSADALAGSYKGVFFILQGLYYLKHGTYIATKAELLPLLESADYAVLQRSAEINSGIPVSFPESFELLFTWCRHALESL